MLMCLPSLHPGENSSITSIEQGYDTNGAATESCYKLFFQSRCTQLCKLCHCKSYLLHDSVYVRGKFTLPTTKGQRIHTAYNMFDVSNSWFSLAALYIHIKIAFCKYFTLWMHESFHRLLFAVCVISLMLSTGNGKWNTATLSSCFLFYIYSKCSEIFLQSFVSSQTLDILKLVPTGNKLQKKKNTFAQEM